MPSISKSIFSLSLVRSEIGTELKKKWQEQRYIEDKRKK
jgi:hypothetical protein